MVSLTDGTHRKTHLCDGFILEKFMSAIRFRWNFQSGSQESISVFEIWGFDLFVCSKHCTIFKFILNERAGLLFDSVTVSLFAKGFFVCVLISFNFRPFSVDLIAVNYLFFFGYKRWQYKPKMFYFHSLIQKQKEILNKCF